jgi:hypothetical protein
LTSYPQLCRLPLAAGSKRPLLVRWSTIDPADDIIAKVFEENPGCNVGLRLDQFVVVDCDTPEMVAWWSEHGPATVFQSQGNPEHRSFWYSLDPDDEARPSRRPGIDVKTGPGHQCVIPPSVHPSGKKYRWLGSRVDGEYRPRTIAGTTISALLDQIAPERGPVGDGAGWDVVMEGEGRDNFLIGAAGYLRARGCSVAAVRQGIADWNESFCEPRLPSKDLDRIAKSSGRWDAEQKLSMNEDVEFVGE